MFRLIKMAVKPFLSDFTDCGMHKFPFRETGNLYTGSLRSVFSQVHTPGEKDSEFICPFSGFCQMQSYSQPPQLRQLVFAFTEKKQEDETIWHPIVSTGSMRRS